ncbi:MULTISPECIES: hypothetical protein [unclassified Caulobacter]|uniref:hypothetical protein n=1 Tax=unclassified Caulobacter TaxID=2648921 RepID=UPI0007816519|nr:MULTISPECIES: hypothetical protein [unclassified Caulobacter]AZS23301.1 hypothetical protein CSW63_03175 [Caulobacter sp. FWC26]
MTRDEDALRMLAELEAANADLTKRVRAPAWYHPALGLLMGGLCAVQAAPVPGMLAYYAVFIAGLVLLVRAYIKRTGLWVSGYRAGRTRWVAVGLATITTGLMLLSAWLFHTRKETLAPFVFAGLIAVIVTIGGFVWEAAFRADLRDGGRL